MISWGMWIKEGVKEHERTFGGDEYVYYLDYSDSFIGVYTCENINLYTFYYLLYVNYISVTVQNVCVKMFIALLFIVAQNGNNKMSNSREVAK